MFNQYFSKILSDNVEKYCTARQATENSMAHMLSMLND